MTTQNNNTAPAIQAAKRSSMVLFLNEVEMGSCVRVKSGAVRRATTFMASTYAGVDGVNPGPSIVALRRSGAVSVIMTGDNSMKRFAVNDKPALKALYDSFEQAAKWLRTVRSLERLGQDLSCDGIVQQLVSIYQGRIQLAVRGGMSPAQAKEVVQQTIRKSQFMGTDVTFAIDQPSMNSVLAFVAPELVENFDVISGQAEILRSILSDPHIMEETFHVADGAAVTVAPASAVIPTEEVIKETSESPQRIATESKISAA